MIKTNYNQQTWKNLPVFSTCVVRDVAPLMIYSLITTRPGRCQTEDEKTGFPFWLYTILKLSAVLLLKRLSMYSYMKRLTQDYPNPLIFADLPPFIWKVWSRRVRWRCWNVSSEFLKHRYLFVALVFETASSVIRKTVRSRIWCCINEGNSTERIHGCKQPSIWTARAVWKELHV